jgi:hypothetical protein
MAHAVHREDSTPVPEQPCAMQPVDFGADHGEQRSQELRLELAARLAEGCGRDRLAAPQSDPRAPGFLPERVEHEAVAATACIGCHEEQQSDQQLGSQRASSSEVRGLAATARLPGRFEHLLDETHQRFVERREYGVTGFGQPLACQTADDSLLPRRLLCRRLPKAHSITHAAGLHAQAQASSAVERASRPIANLVCQVNGIGLGAGTCAVVRWSAGRHEALGDPDPTRGRNVR